MLLLIGGLPGVGRTTVAREVARRTRGAHVRIDALEAGLVSLGPAPQGRVGAAGYGLAHAVTDTLLAAAPRWSSTPFSRPGLTPTGPG